MMKLFLLKKKKNKSRGVFDLFRQHLSNHKEDYINVIISIQVKNSLVPSSCANYNYSVSITPNLSFPKLRFLLREHTFPQNFYAFTPKSNNFQILLYQLQLSSTRTLQNGIMQIFNTLIQFLLFTTVQKINNFPNLFLLQGKRILLHYNTLS